MIKRYFSSSTLSWTSHQAHIMLQNTSGEELETDWCRKLSFSFFVFVFVYVFVFVFVFVFVSVFVFVFVFVKCNAISLFVYIYLLLRRITKFIYTERLSSLKLCLCPCICLCVCLCLRLCHLQMNPGAVLFPTMYDMLIVMLES